MRQQWSKLGIGLAVAVLLLEGLALAQPPRRPGGGQRGGAREEEPQIKPYAEVITEEAVSDTGIFTVHKVKDRYFYEIPESELGRDFLLVTRIAKTSEGVGYGGQKLGTRVIRWQRHGDRILLRNISYSIVADKNAAVARAVESANNDAIIAAFDIKAIADSGAPVIEVNSLFENEVTEFTARTRLQARGFDRERSFIESALAFPTNIEIRATHTYTRPPEQPGQGGRQQPTNPFRGRGMDPGSASVLMHFSMVKLPEDPMMPRMFDPRVGYFSVRQTDFSRDEHKAVERRFITRWRLEKQDPSAAVSEPVKPIVYWIDPGTPEKWRPYLMKGVEMWQPAFEAAGFSNAIIAKQGPAPEEDSEWHPEDARYSVIRWLPSTIENASGPHVHDPRTGEILETDIQFYHNVQNLLRSWYFIQVGPLDPRVRKLPMPDELMGELIAYVTAHEVGHTLGFQHNMKASSMYPFEKVRDPEWLKKMGHTPTLMDYSRFNYVVQPEDRIDPEYLIPGIGPYDIWATKWGYQPIAGAESSDDELATLDKWAKEQDAKPWLRFSTAGSRGADPGELTEAVGDANAVAATRLGLKNLERVADMLVPAVRREGRAWDDLEELYGRLLGQWVREMNHVAAVVGGYHSQQRHAGQQKEIRFEPIPGTRQKEAVLFLNEYAFQTPEFMVKSEILRRIEASGVLGRIQNSQRSVLNSLLNSNRFTRLVEQAALDGDTAYSPAAFMKDLERGVWTELGSDDVQIDAYRRNLQRTYLSIADSRLNGSGASAGDLRAFLRGQLKSLDHQIAGAVSRTQDEATRYHLEDARVEIAQILDPKFERSSGNQSNSPFGRRGLTNDEFGQPESCWPDLIIRPE